MANALVSRCGTDILQLLKADIVWILIGCLKLLTCRFAEV